MFIATEVKKEDQFFNDGMIPVHRSCFSYQ